ncbi:MAG: class I SAM-dependent methyltransferase [Methanophagales archaeon]|nr:class I SAM-dependent methyltransferase [Methanophagales archaeon]
MDADMSFKEYAAYYDLIYKDKDYETEVDFIEDIFGEFIGASNPKNILEVGCGTGNYTKILVDRGYEVTAVDVSEDMLKLASEKCDCEVIKGDISEITINDKFDTCIAMFAVMGYITENADIIKALNNIHKHLKPNGIFVFDVWNGLAVLRLLPEQRLKEVESDEILITRFAVPNLKAFDHICEVNYKLIIQNKRDTKLKEINEKHVMRFYFPQELKYYLENAGFEVLKICPFLDLNGRVDENVWNIAVIARAVGGEE